jgi:YbgC/YbaW family acyl-CoA thioester hydrolase
MRPLHVEQLRVPLADTDASGRIHWTAVFRWAEAAEHALLRRLGRTPSEAGSYPRRAAEVVYHQPVSFDDEIEVRLGIGSAGRTSVTFAWHIVNSGQTCAEGRHTVVHVDQEGEPAAWPVYLRDGLGLLPQS